jgi:hypothetical protein
MRKHCYARDSSFNTLDKFEFWFTFFLAVCMSTARERRVVFERVLYIYLIVTLIQTTVITHNIRIF